MSGRLVIVTEIDEGRSPDVCRIYRNMFLPQEFLFTNDIDIADVSHIKTLIKTNSEMANIRIQTGSFFLQGTTILLVTYTMKLI